MSNEYFLRIRPGKDTPAEYHSLGVAFLAGRWYRLPAHWEWEGQQIDTKERFSKIVNANQAPVFQVATKAEAEAISEVDRQAEVMRMIAEQQAASKVAPVEAAVVPNVTAVKPAEGEDGESDGGSGESDEPKSDESKPARGRRGRGSKPAEGEDGE